jgi:hypothetical protein
VELLSDFKVAWGTAELGGEGLDCLLDGAALATQFSRTPVKSAQVVENCATDTELRIAAELDLFGWVELTEGVEQSYHPGAVEIFDRDMLRQPLMDTPGDKAHDGQVLDHELFLLGSEQICGSRAQRLRNGRSFFLCTLRGDVVDRADILRRLTATPRTSLAFSCLLHIHHPTCVEEVEPELLWS